MSYSFFGTCFNDQKQFFDCLNSILNQTICPKEIILINSGEENIEKEIQDKVLDKKVKYRATILGSVGNDLNPCLLQNETKCLKSDLYALSVLFDFECLRLFKVSSCKVLSSVVSSFIYYYR